MTETNKNTNKNNVPIWFWICAVILALWGLMGMYVYYDFVTTTPEKMAKNVMDGMYTQGYADSLENTPACNRSLRIGCFYRGVWGFNAAYA